MAKHCKAGSLPTFKQQEEYHETICFRGERKTIEDRMWGTISRLESAAVETMNWPRHQQLWADIFPHWQFTEERNFEGGFIPGKPENSQMSTIRALPDEIPMEEGEISSDSELAPSVLEVPTINWANYIGVNSVHYRNMGHDSRIQATESNIWNHENTLRETKKEFATDLQLLMTETTKYPKLLKTLDIRKYTRGIQTV